MATEARPEITAEGILATAERLGIALETSGSWYDRAGGCGCPAGVAALLLDERLARLDQLGVVDLRDAGLSTVQIYGLLDGFEEIPHRQGLFPPNKRAEYRHCFAVGRAVAAAIEAD